MVDMEPPEIPEDHQQHSLRERILSWRLPEWSILPALLVLCLLSYAVLIPWLGYYWDDWVFLWISQKLGAEGLARYFETKRPVWGLFYQATRFLGEEPWRWQVFGLFWIWVSGLALWGTLRLLWPKFRHPAAWAALAFVVYPGFNQQAIAICYGHFFIILTCYLFSLAAMLAALRGIKPIRLWWLLSGLFSLVNLLSMEYFFLLELLRPLLLWVVACENAGGIKQRLRAVMRTWLPYLGLLLGAVLWRTLIFEHQTTNYQLDFLVRLKQAPLATLAGLPATIAGDMWMAGVSAWTQVLQIPGAGLLGRQTALLLGGLILLATLLAAIYLLLQREPLRVSMKPEPWVLQAFGLGLAGLFLAGWPFWLTELPVGLGFPNSRFSLSFMIGAVLLLVSLLGLLPQRFRFNLLFFAVLLGFSVGYQFQQSTVYRRDWNNQRRFFWQLAWRIPALQPDTAMVSNDMPFSFNSDNSFTAPLNWIFTPYPVSERMPYMFYYASNRKDLGLRGLKPDTPIKQDYLAAQFYGNTSDLVGIYYYPPGCLRVLDAETDAVNATLPVLLRQVAEMSDVDRIQADAPQGVYNPPASIFGEEPQHGWCYYFQKAELARQNGDWEEVGRLGEIAFSLDDHPNDAMERLVFIEGYAHLGNWQRALELTRQTVDITAMAQPPVCALWQRISRTVAPTPEMEQAVTTLENELGCRVRQE